MFLLLRYSQAGSVCRLVLRAGRGKTAVGRITAVQHQVSDGVEHLIPLRMAVDHRLDGILDRGDLARLGMLVSAERGEQEANQGVHGVLLVAGGIAPPRCAAVAVVGAQGLGVPGLRRIQVLVLVHCLVAGRGKAAVQVAIEERVVPFDIERDAGGRQIVIAPVARLCMPSRS